MLARVREGDLPCEWRLVLVDEDGHLDHVFLIRPEPTSPWPDSASGRARGRCRPSGPRPGTRRGPTRGRMIVELAATTATVVAFDPDRHPRWALLIRRAQTRLAALTDDQRPGGAAHPATSRADVHQRHPRRELDRWTRVRDRHCVGLMCTRPAHANDLDHTHDWRARGLSVAGNLGAVCRHCHRLKHEGGWRLRQPEPGRFAWHTLAGATYAVAPRPVLADPPEPRPRPDGRPRPVTDIQPPPDVDGPSWTDRWPPRPTGVPPRPPKPRTRGPINVDDTHEPPF